MAAPTEFEPASRLAASMEHLRFPESLFASRIQSVSLRGVFNFAKLNAVRCRNFQIPAQTQTYGCAVDAEPLHRYRPGGYHPITFGDVLKGGRYEILHKLGWGGYSTTWAARDKSNGQNVAIKVKVSDIKHTHELEILRTISTLPRRHPGWSHLNRMLDSFTVVGPNGTHDCLVLELVGPSVAHVVESYCRDDRLPAKFAKRFAHQALQGLDFLAAHDIGHGDLHTGNLAITIPGLDSLYEKDFFDRLGTPETGPVYRLDGKPLSSGGNVPTYIVRPALFIKDLDTTLSSPSVKIIDFGEAFFNNDTPVTLHTPLPLRAPEAIFEDVIDRRADLWSAGCLLFELITGQPPFDVIMLTKPILVPQMMAFATDGLPSRWRDKWQAMQKDLPGEDDADRDHSFTLQEWLTEVYFDNGRQAEFTKEDIMSAGKLIESMLKLEPSHRAGVRDVLADSWLSRV